MQQTSASNVVTRVASESSSPEREATSVNLWLFMLAPFSFLLTVMLIVYLRS